MWKPIFESQMNCRINGSSYFLMHIIIKTNALCLVLVCLGALYNQLWTKYTWATMQYHWAMLTKLPTLTKLPCSACTIYNGGCYQYLLINISYSHDTVWLALLADRSLDILYWCRRIAHLSSDAIYHLRIVRLQGSHQPAAGLIHQPPKT